jgi:hypothetical protein
MSNDAGMIKPSPNDFVEFNKLVGCALVLVAPSSLTLDHVSLPRCLKFSSSPSCLSFSPWMFQIITSGHTSIAPLTTIDNLITYCFPRTALEF